MAWETSGGESPAILAVVCDGVSGSRHGGDAAQIAVDEALRIFRNVPPEDGDPGYVALLVRDAHRRVAAAFPDGSALCAMDAVLVVPSAGRFVIAHAGDTQTFRHHGGLLRRLTQDHASVRPLRMNGEPVYQHGVPTLRRGLTQAVGQVGEVLPDVVIEPFEAGDLIVLASDGVFETALARFLEDAGVGVGESQVASFVEAMRDESGDDTTLVVIRMGWTAQVRGLWERLDAWGDLDGDARDRVLRDVTDLGARDPVRLAQCLRREEDEGRSLGLVRALSADPGVLSRAEWIALLDRAVREGRPDLARELVTVLRRL